LFLKKAGVKILIKATDAAAKLYSNATMSFFLIYYYHKLPAIATIFHKVLENGSDFAVKYRPESVFLKFLQPQGVFIM
jgi:hypothetical protein